MNYELNMILNKVKGDFICVYGEKRKTFSSKEELDKSAMEKNCTVYSISAQDGAIVLELKKWESPKTDLDGEWTKEHEMQFGEKPSSF